MLHDNGMWKSEHPAGSSVLILMGTPWDASVRHVSAARAPLLPVLYTVTLYRHSVYIQCV